jgi:S1-C subfamily serine protease
MRFGITASIGERGKHEEAVCVRSGCTSTTVEAADPFSGSGVVIGTQGEILTNAHVVEACTERASILSDFHSRSVGNRARGMHDETP